VWEQLRQLGDTWSAESFVRNLEGSLHIYHRHNYDDDTQEYNDDLDLIKGRQEGRNVCGESNFLCRLLAFR
jgi:hypothetical protein